MCGLSGFRLRRYAALLANGGVIAYPTEAVYGLGCDPRRYDAVARLLDLKGRSARKGLILISAEADWLSEYIAPLSEELAARMAASWPGPVTWVVPAAAGVPAWLTGGRGTIALRVTAHPVASALCRAFRGALVSTSANRSGGIPARTALRARLLFGPWLDAVVPGKVGGLGRPTRIIDACSGIVLRE
ncbi:MAG TPA: Sua5/YciO/YrdC/YwlC family protein [Nitrococcus sp.]|nr:Sua5/YciO/YrdC/YwlC family protein [Nitrococcus sp.]